MAKVIPIGQPANESERQAIGFLRDHLPNGWLIFHNFEMRQGEEVFEIDIAILAPHAVYLVDVKGTRGNIDVYGSKWYPEGRQPFFSPLAKLRSHAKTMATIIRESNTGLIELRKANWSIAPYPMERHGFVHPDAWYDEYRRIDELFLETLKP